MTVVECYPECRAREDFRHHSLKLDRFLFCHAVPVLAGVPARARPALSRSRLELPHDTGLHIVTPTAKLLQQSRLLDLLLERLERPVQPVALLQCDFDHARIPLLIPGFASFPRLKTIPPRALSRHLNA